MREKDGAPLRGRDEQSWPQDTRIHSVYMVSPGIKEIRGFFIYMCLFGLFFNLKCY